MKQLVLAFIMLFAPILFAASLEERVSELEAKIEELLSQEKATSEEIELLKEELRRLRLEAAAPAVEMKSHAGLGPAASKIYYSPQKMTIGGYGEIRYEGFQHGTKTDRGDTLKFIPYFGYKLSDDLIMNTELEFEHAGIKNIEPRKPEVYIEFMYLDFLLRPQFNLRTGLFLVPSSRVNEYHEPTVYLGVSRPDVEQQIIPTVWRELGLMAYGQLSDALFYKAALVNGLRTDTMSDWIAGGRQRGAEANHNRLAGAFRLEAASGPWELGGFLYAGGGEDKGGAAEKGKESADFLLWGLEGSYAAKGLWLKGLLAQGEASGNDAFKFATKEDGSPRQPNLAKAVEGFYLEAGYNIMPILRPESLGSLVPFVRYEAYDLNKEVFAGRTRDPKRDRKLWTVGLEYKPHPQAVLKVDYQARDTRSADPQGKGTGLDESKIDQLNIGVGFIF